MREKERERERNGRSVFKFSDIIKLEILDRLFDFSQINKAFQFISERKIIMFNRDYNPKRKIMFGAPATHYYVSAKSIFRTKADVAKIMKNTSGIFKRIRRHHYYETRAFGNVSEYSTVYGYEYEIEKACALREEGKTEEEPSVLPALDQILRRVSESFCELANFFIVYGQDAVTSEP